MTTLTIKIPDNKTTKVSAYIKRLGGEVVGKEDQLKTENEISLPLKENELTMMSLAYAEKAFSPGWDITDQKANEYWDSF